MSDTPPTAPGPVGGEAASPGGRFFTLDVLRGVAVLGILVPNIAAFAWPHATAENPILYADYRLAVGDYAPIRYVWNDLGTLVLALLFQGKFMFIFASLFGAGATLYGRGLTPGRATARWYARCGWLLVIGLLHACVVWKGDVLVYYALAGLVLVWALRDVPPRVLTVLAIVSYAVGLGITLAFQVLARAQNEMSATPSFPIDQALGEHSVFALGSWAEVLHYRLGTLKLAYLAYPFTWFWMTTGLMLGGVAMARSGLLLGRLPAREYAKLAGVGVAVGLGATIYLWWHFVGGRPADPDTDVWAFLAQPVGVPLAVGYIALVCLMARSRAWRVVTAPLAAVGRMALTNYLLQSVVCTLLFYGYGLGWYGKVQYPALWGIVLCVWAGNVTLSVLWLHVFRLRYGPAEWAWRSLTRWRLVPMRRAGIDDAPASM